MTARVPVGVIGVGALGRHHARHLSQIPDAELVGVYDRDAARAKQVADEVGCTAFADLDALLGKVKGVSCAVITPAHYEVGLHVLGRGVGILMEKPIAATAAEADELIAAAAKARIPLHVGQIERFNRAVRAATPYLADPRYIECQRLAPFATRGSDVSVILDLMVHDIDLVLHLTGARRATEIRAVGTRLLSSHIDLVNARLELEGGQVATLTTSRLSAGRVRRARIFQQNGYLTLDLHAGTGEFVKLKGGFAPDRPEGQALEDVVERIPLSAPEGDALGLETRAFVAALRGEKNDGVTGVEGRAALALALAVGEAVDQHPLLKGR
ncbi:MAG: Gfo/Idh/MocA family oxidoreductase [Gemmatimonadetes bacterium]|nr:Gfo/Idh/MocA family oxidoreductase [Gemmatimonadota bacterium]